MDLLVNRSDLHELEFVDERSAELEPGQARLRVDAFGLTANNITYAVFGDAMKYWDFFPAPDGWGRIPVWGFGDVVESRQPEVLNGCRVFGYFPMSSELVVSPGRVTDRGFCDTAAHRAPMASAYNTYARVDADPAYEEKFEDHQILLRPLFYTSFVIDDFLADNGWFGARTIVLSSASSKTAAGAAFFLAEHDDVEVVGLTSPGNVEFVEGLGCYDVVATYDGVAAIPREPAVFVDVAGSPTARAAIHRHFGDQLVHSSAVGGTHWEEARTQTAEALPGAQPTFFFAPDQIRKRANDWGQERLNAAFGAAWQRAVSWSAGWLDVVHGKGPGALETAYVEVLHGRTHPSVGHVLSLST